MELASLSVLWDNLHVSDIVVITGHKVLPPENPWTGTRNLDYSGAPFMVMSMDYPFLAIVDNFGNRAAVDFRVFKFTKVSRNYWDVLAAQPAPKTKEKYQKVFNDSRRKRQKKVQRDDRDCPRCGSRCCQRMFTEPDSNGELMTCWHRFCDACGLDQGPIDDGGNQRSPLNPRNGG